jgi:hypothetical protein
MSDNLKLVQKRKTPNMTNILKVGEEFYRKNAFDDYTRDFAFIFVSECTVHVTVNPFQFLVSFTRTFSQARFDILSFRRTRRASADGRLFFTGSYTS